MPILTVETLCAEAAIFSAAESRHQGFLTISNALQWRLQYSRVIERAGQEEGIFAVRKSVL